jgi:hypothetical protein
LVTFIPKKLKNPIEILSDELRSPRGQMQRSNYMLANSAARMTGLFPIMWKASKLSSSLLFCGMEELLPEPPEEFPVDIAGMKYRGMQRCDTHKG